MQKIKQTIISLLLVLLPALLLLHSLSAVFIVSSDVGDAGYEKKLQSFLNNLEKSLDIGACLSYNVKCHSVRFDQTNGTFEYKKASCCYFDGGLMLLTSQDSMYTLTLRLGQNLTNEIEVQFGATVVAAQLPASVPGYTLVGWYTDSEFQNEFISRVVDGDFELFAMLVPNALIREFTVRLVSSIDHFVDGEYFLGEVFEFNVFEGDIFEFPNMTRAGYVLIGWYRDRQLRNRFDQNTAITGDITLYARWANENSCAAMCGSVDWQDAGLIGLVLAVVAAGMAIMMRKKRFKKDKRLN